MSPEERRAAQRILPLVDLTNLSEDASAGDIAALCRAARTPAGNVAAVCIQPRHVAAARNLLAGTGVAVATVANFPEGEADQIGAAAEVAAAVADGAQEVDVVFPWRALLAGHADSGAKLIAACRASAGRGILLKAILETGGLATPRAIRAAAMAAIEGGADFIKTSTGRLEPGATLAAAEVMIRIIAEVRQRRRWIGFKASGGIRTLAQAREYVTLYDGIMGTGAACAAGFRIGASSLLDDLLRVLGLQAEG